MVKPRGQITKWSNHAVKSPDGRHVSQPRQPRLQALPVHAPRTPAPCPPGLRPPPPPAHGASGEGRRRRRRRGVLVAAVAVGGAGGAVGGGADGGEDGAEAAAEVVAAVEGGGEVPQEGLQPPALRQAAGSTNGSNELGRRPGV